MSSPVPGSWAADLDDPDHQVDAGDDGEDDKPEPEEDVDLLVEDVHAEDAEGVQGHERPGAAILVEGALGHPGEDLRHGVHAVLGVLARELDNLRKEKRIEEGTLFHEEIISQDKIRNRTFFSKWSPRVSF